jgi:uncharacterized protein
MIGKVLKQRGRKGLWLANKIGPRKHDDFMRALELSLKRLQVDQVDLLHVHALMGPEDLAAVAAKGGAYEAVGITCHALPYVVKTPSNSTISIAPRWPSTPRCAPR